MVNVNMSIEQDQCEMKLFQKLNDLSNDLTKCQTLALTIHAIFKDNLQVLAKLFDFYRERDLVDMASDLLENDIMSKKFNLNENDLFDAHLNKFTHQIIKREQSSDADAFYLKLFTRMNATSQEKLIVHLLDKYRSKFLFLKSSSSEQQQQQSSITLSEFYAKLAESKEALFHIRNLLLVYKRYIGDYGLFLIDGFLNIEKQLFATGHNLEGAERRSLNIIRRLCVVNLIPQFVHLVDKLDNRHCYRWIEKSLEFYCKYAFNSILVSRQQQAAVIRFNYTNLSLIHDSELRLVNQEGSQLTDEQVAAIKEQLFADGLTEYKYDIDEDDESSSPFSCVFKILDEIGKKLDWHTVKLGDAEHKLSYLFKMKNEKQVNVSLLNKQISFYGLAIFLKKLIEFQAVVKTIFSDRFVMARSYKHILSNEYNDDNEISNKTAVSKSYEPFAFAIDNLVYCIKLWQRFNQHKEFMTIVSKCLNNSKLDTLSFYKSFLNDYYNNAFTTTTSSWSSVSSLDLKAKIVALANLFINEKSSFQNFFDELKNVLVLIDEQQSEDDDSNYAHFILSDNYFEAFELTSKNFIRFFSKLLIEKFTKLIEQKPPNLFRLLQENDQYLGHLVVLLQVNIGNYSNLYELLFQLIKQKNSFSYTAFSAYIYDVQVVQDFALLASSSSKTKFDLKLYDSAELNEPDRLGVELLHHLNSHRVKYQCLREFLIENAATSLKDLFEQALKC